MLTNARAEALRLLALADADAKCEGALRLHAIREAIDIDASEHLAEAGDSTAVATGRLEPPRGSTLPGRPERPVLVAPTLVPTRSAFTTEGRAALLHAITHIEFNAVNLALDAVWRFPSMPDRFYRDWLLVAGEEAKHFMLLRGHLRRLGFDYGAFAAHDGLWLMAERTRHDVLARMALVPRTLEARGLDATPALQAKLVRAGDDAAAAILAVILADEVGHVAIGNRWYRWLCERDGRDADASYPELASRYRAPRLRPPFNVAARRAAGFSEAEIARLDETGPRPSPGPEPRQPAHDDMK